MGLAFHRGYCWSQRQRGEFLQTESKKSALRYEVGLSIKTGNIFWVNGGYPLGEWNVEMIFQDALVHELEEGERVEADGGYKNSAPKYDKCPGTIWTEAEKKEMQQRVRSRQETVNLRIKIGTSLLRRTGTVCTSFRMCFWLLPCSPSSQFKTASHSFKYI